MTRSQVITKLRREGYAATVGRVRQALLNGYVQPLPSKAARWAYDFQPEHLRQLRRYFVYVRPGPRPGSAVGLDIKGSNDRVRRLEHDKQQRAARQRRLEAADQAISWLEGLANQLEG